MDHEAIAKTIDSIARSHFHQLRDRLHPLAAQNSDSLDFIDTAVWAIRDALEEAYQGDKVDAATSAALKRTACALEARMGSRVLRSLDALIDAAAA